MDRVKAEQLGSQLRGQKIEEWTIESYVNHGKSAAVFKARRDNAVAALKIFDDDLIKRYGDEAQFARIERELTLVGQNHPNMVPILGGGFDKYTGNHYVIMQFIDGPNLADCLTEVPVENIPSLIEQLASAAHFLEDLGLCHRDIKPENIALVDSLSHLLLLDFGVLRPIGVTGLTDGEVLRAFVGTLQYSSPEFLLRQEEDSIEGWRALSFYQIGGVLHDLIMRKPMFFEYSQPYAALVNAVQFEQPQIHSSAVPAYLIELAGRCLLKDWRFRSKLVSWNDFSAQASQLDSTSLVKQRVTNRSALILAQRLQAAGRGSAAPPPNELLRQTIDYLKVSVRGIRSENSVFPPATVNRSSTHRLRVSFDRAPNLGLEERLLILLDVEVIEAVSSAIQITARAYLGANEPEPKASEATLLYGGVYSGESIRQALELYLYEAMDVAQECPPLHGSSRSLSDMKSEKS